ITAPLATDSQIGDDDGTWNWSFGSTDGPDESQTVTIIATDSDGASTSTAFTLVVINVAPSVAADDAITVAVEGATANNSGTFSDSGADTVAITASVGTVSLVGAQNGTWSWSFNSTDGPDESQTVTITATDSDGAASTATFTLVVINAAPSVAANNAEVTIDEGQTAINSGTFSDPGADIVAVTASVGAISQAGTQNGTWSWSFGSTDGPAESQTVTITATDSDGAATSAIFDLVVINLAPSVGPITAPVDPVQVNTSINASAGFTDPGIGDTHTAVWDWGDNTTSPGTVTETGGAGSVSDSHTYTAAGVYTVTLTVSDEELASDQSVFQFVVVYDPDGGFVTGGGWIDSPLGAFTSDPSLTGNAFFGFVSKYLNGATTPTGQTEFQFKVADLDFHSEVYDWLVVAGPSARYKGTGTINNQGNYGFMLVAVDGSINGGGGTDKFRIKIWDIDNNDSVVYDNQLGESDDSNASTEIGGGSIIIHN
ncbi:MAG: hypothetical protein IH872_11575, partial [Chloroflexi bacterium]|nr:hypothetical protein [Chloroflexota bacterium]